MHMTINILIFITLLTGMYSVTIQSSPSNNTTSLYSYTINEINHPYILKPKIKLFHDKLTLFFIIPNCFVNDEPNQSNTKLQADHFMDTLGILSVDINPVILPDMQEAEMRYVAYIGPHSYFTSETNVIYKNYFDSWFYDVFYDEQLDEDIFLFSVLSVSDVLPLGLRIQIAKPNKYMRFGNGMSENDLYWHDQNGYSLRGIKTKKTIKQYQYYYLNNLVEGDRHVYIDLCQSYFNYDPREIGFLSVSRNNIILFGSMGYYCLYENNNIWMSNVDQFTLKPVELEAKWYEEYYGDLISNMSRAIEKGAKPVMLINNDGYMLFAIDSQYEPIGKAFNNENTGQILISKSTDGNAWERIKYHLPENSFVTWLSAAYSHNCYYLLISKLISGNHNLYITYSEDQALTWKTPAPVTTGDVMDAQPALYAYDGSLYFAFVRNPGKADGSLIYGSIPEPEFRQIVDDYNAGLKQNEGEGGEQKAPQRDDN